jgi:hypothetical protein
MLVLQQPVLALDVSVLQRPVLPLKCSSYSCLWRRVCPMAACASLGVQYLSYSNLSCFWMCLSYTTSLSCLDVPVLQQLCSPCGRLVLQQPVIPLDVPVLQQRAVSGRPQLTFDLSILQLFMFSSCCRSDISGEDSTAVCCRIDTYSGSPILCTTRHVQRQRATVGQTRPEAAQGCRMTGTFRLQMHHCLMWNRHVKRQHNLL